MIGEVSAWGDQYSCFTIGLLVVLAEVRAFSMSAFV